MAEVDEKTVGEKDGETDAGAEGATQKVVGQSDAGKEQSVEEKETHPLEPGGERFKEVWARAKKAEAETQREREGRIAAETEARILREVGTVKTVEKEEKVYSWAELEKFIENGQMTRADANEYREAINIKKAVREAEDRTTERIRTENKLNTANSELADYVKEVPDINVVGSDTRNKLETEFAWLAQFYGNPKKGTVERAAMELNAVRNVLGPLSELSGKKESDRLTRRSRESVQESNSTVSRSGERGSGKRLVDNLSPDMKAHYERMMQKTNDYPNGWDDVEKELSWKRPTLIKGRR